MPKILLTDKAQNDLEAIGDFYAGAVSEDFAEEAVAYILRHLDQLKLFPGMGRPSQIEDVRDLIFLEYPFYAAYTMMDGNVVVLRVNHQRKQRPSDW